MRPLERIRVLNLSPDLSAAYCAMLLSDFAAEVIHCDISSGTANRPPGHETFALEPGSLLAAALRGGQRVTTAPGFTPGVRAAALAADVVIESGELTTVEMADLRTERPALVLLSIRPFGVEGPWAGRPATEFTVQAFCGSSMNRGMAAAEPLAAAGRLAEWVSGSYAATATLAALRTARTQGRGEHIDLSGAEVAHICYNMFHSVSMSMLGKNGDTVTRTTSIPSIEPTRDGWVGLSVNTPDQFRAFLDLIGHPELGELPGVFNALRREPHRAVLEAAIGPWLAGHTSAEVIELCSQRRIPVAQVNSVGDLVKLPHMRSRGLFETDAGGLPRLRPPFVVDNVRLARVGGPPVDAPLEWDEREEPPVTAVDGDSELLPLAGVRVLDMTTWWAGPCATQLLSAFGAEVIKVESHTRYDGMRDVGARDRDQPEWWDWSWMFQAVNTDKLGITLDLRREEARSLFHRLAADADLVIENGPPSVLPKLGVEWADLHARNPRLTLVRMPGFGLSGPWADMRAYDPTISQSIGVAALTGYRGGSPVGPRGVCDNTAGVHGALVAIAALEETRLSGIGHHIESAMSDVAANLVLEGILSHAVSGQHPERSGNRGTRAVPQGIYRCAGTEAWVALAVCSDEQWAVLCEAIDRPEWAAAPDFATESGRRVNCDAVDAALRDFCADKDPEALAQLLRAAGVPTERVRTPAQAFDAPQLRGRGFVEKIDHPVVGAHEYPSLPFRFASRSDSTWFRRRSPRLGEHNDVVLRGMLGLEASELGKLAADGIIGTRPH